MSVLGPITAAKEAVTVIDLMEHLSGGPGERSGKVLLFKCPLHDDHDPSQQVDPEKNLWHCFPCGVGGDVVRLAQLAWDFPLDGRGAAMAAAELLLLFGHELPQRPPAWFRKQERQRPARDLIDRATFEYFHRRLFRRYFYPLVEIIEDREEREAEAEHLWGAAEMLTRLMAERMMGRAR